ncbi:MAG: DNA repair protein RadC [Elusimicrobia bacterium]|nr:DNA repair protein RadC [Elusimicrobiota bacterium]MDD7502527.1 DNA repair protein RadC [Elusimicrobiota bacterium]MDY5728844.1 DNA repair protein RadC [Elusimicrobiaceae bacterium]
MPNKPSYFGHRERIREKFAAAGLDSFLDHEILELLLTYAVPRRDTKPLAWALLKKFGTLATVFDADENQLTQVDGIGTGAARFLRLIRAVFKKYSLDEVKETVSIRTPQQVLEYCKASLAGKKEECLEIIYLSVRNTVMSTQVVASGLIDRVAVSPRKIVECALAAKASAIILVHNHPSGDATPSQEDISLTQDVIQAAALFGILVHDHIIVGKGSHYSLKANGKI